MFSQTSDIQRNVLHKFTEPSMEPPYRRTFVGTPSLRLEIGVIIWNLLWLSRRLIICTDQTRIFISTVPNTYSFWIR